MRRDQTGGLRDSKHPQLEVRPGVDAGQLVLAEASRPASAPSSSSAVRACTVTPDGPQVISASDDQTLKVWDLVSGREVATLRGHTAWVSACAVTPDGRQVVSASYDQTLKVWDLASGREVAPLHGHADRVSACVVTPDGRRVVSASEDQTLKVWDLASGQEVATMHGHADWVNACAVTPDGLRVVSASDDRTLKVWNLESGACLFTHRASVGYCAVAATATTIIAGDANGAVWFLDWPSASPPQLQSRRRRPARRHR